MTTTDSNGIVFLEETDPISPFHTLINTLQAGTSTALDNIAAVGPSTIALSAGWTGGAPSVIRIGSLCVLVPGNAITRASSSFTLTAGSPVTLASGVPSGFRPGGERSALAPIHVNSGVPAMGRVYVSSAGAISIVPSVSGSIGAGGWPNAIYLPTMTWRV